MSELAAGVEGGSTVGWEWEFSLVVTVVLWLWLLADWGWWCWLWLGAVEGAVFNGGGGSNKGDDN